MENIYLSPNFTLSEMTRSYQAEKHGIVNKPTRREIESLRVLCTEVLQPLRDFHGGPIMVSSGFRSTTLNRIVGGSPTSQHLRGEAADVVFSDLGTAIDWMCFVQHHCSFDQMLLERNRRTGAAWLHLSCRRDIQTNRRQIMVVQAG